jgi:hypothetical protein
MMNEFLDLLMTLFEGLAVILALFLFLLAGEIWSERKNR